MSHTSISRVAIVVMSAAALCLSAPYAHSQDFDPTPEPTTEPTYQYLVKATPTPTPTPEDEELQETPTPTPEVEKPQTKAAKTPDTTMQALAAKINVEIGINRTASTTDDLVRVSGSVPCLIRLASPLGGEGTVKVILTASSTVIRTGFNGHDPGVNRVSLYLPKNGEPQPFTILGTKVSQKPNDITIYAHQDYYTAARCGSAALTVYDFKDAKVRALRGGKYGFGAHLGDASYTYSAGTAAYLRARVDLYPSGLDARAPQLKGFRVGLVQNALNSYNGANISSPYIWPEAWKDSVPRGYTVRVPSSRTDQTRISSVLLDTVRYDNQEETYLYDSGSVTYPGVTSESEDSPSYGINTVYKFPSGNEAYTSYTYRVKKVVIQYQFLAYAYLLSIEGNKINDAHALRQTAWRLNVSSTRKNQYAQVSASDSTVQSVPKIQGPTVNDVLDNPTQQPVPSTTLTTLRKP